MLYQTLLLHCPPMCSAAFSAAATGLCRALLDPQLGATAASASGPGSAFSDGPKCGQDPCKKLPPRTGPPSHHPMDCALGSCKAKMNTPLLNHFSFLQEKNNRYNVFICEKKKKKKKKNSEILCIWILSASPRILCS